MTKYKIIPDPDYGYLRADPLPTPEEVEKYYREAFYTEKKFNDSSIEVQREEKEFFDARWEDICTKCLHYFGHLEALSVFDVGCGFAQALLYFKNKGMIVNGLDPSPEAVDYAQK